MFDIWSVWDGIGGFGVARCNLPGLFVAPTEFNFDFYL